MRLLGEIETPAARDALLALVAGDGPAARVDAAIRALARQGEPRARDRVSALAQTVLNGLGGNAMFEEARRLHAAAFYLLALDAESRPAGITMLSRLSPIDQADAVAWAVQTLCERAVRRPTTAAPLAAARAALEEAVPAMGVRIDGVPAGTFTCPPAP